ncbi:hypothetical protein QIL60_gp1 [ssRNA phage SRR6253161_2]|uniref:Uncharacterized protein n=1 Tax=ssRNA phage SRR6253161_2 TaxID=2786489 RepID=A0A8S5L5I3_9VIRU|nr:hypothetical protein QIL60_gp1 [ssRNA phage SRR6253161_2]DAD52530.1 TPA_asm: hypothetical protein [ssRNA phage SRR6253161_2]
MNLFQHLDLIYPVLPNRSSGEVVAITFHLWDASSLWSLTGRATDIFWKEKAWYRNTSMNATYMYRGICRELSQAEWFTLLRRTEQRALKRTIRTTISDVYTAAFDTNNQHFEIDITNVGRETWSRRLISVDNANIGRILFFGSWSCFVNKG